MKVRTLGRREYSDLKPAQWDAMTYAIGQSGIPASYETGDLPEGGDDKTWLRLVSPTPELEAIVVAAAEAHA